MPHTLENDDPSRSPTGGMLATAPDQRGAAATEYRVRHDDQASSSTDLNALDLELKRRSAEINSQAAELARREAQLEVDRAAVEVDRRSIHQHRASSTISTADVTVTGSPAEIEAGLEQLQREREAWERERRGALDELDLQRLDLAQRVAALEKQSEELERRHDSLRQLERVCDERQRTQRVEIEQLKSSLEEHAERLAGQHQEFVDARDGEQQRADNLRAELEQRQRTLEAGEEQFRRQRAEWEDHRRSEALREEFRGNSAHHGGLSLFKRSGTEHPPVVPKEPPPAPPSRTPPNNGVTLSTASLLAKYGVELEPDETAPAAPAAPRPRQVTLSSISSEREQALRRESTASAVAAPTSAEASPTEPLAQTETKPAAQELASHEDDPDVSAYMAQLIEKNRSNSPRSGGASQAPAPAATVAPRTVAESPAIAATAEPRADNRPMTPRPTLTDQPVNLSAMRELANMNARAAINTHLNSQVSGATIRALTGLMIGLVAVAIFSWRHLSGDWWAWYAAGAGLLGASVVLLRYVDVLRRIRRKRVRPSGKESRAAKGGDVSELGPSNVDR